MNPFLFLNRIKIILQCHEMFFTLRFISFYLQSNFGLLTHPVKQRNSIVYFITWTSFPVNRNENRKELIFNRSIYIKSMNNEGYL